MKIKAFSLCALFILSITGLVLLSAGKGYADQQLDSRIAEAQKGKQFVMLELGSIGCIPCEAMKPVMSRLTSTYKGKLQVIFVDVKKDHQGARKFGVYGIPTQVFLDRNGREFHRHVGFYDYELIVPVLKKAGI